MISANDLERRYNVLTPIDNKKKWFNDASGWSMTGMFAAAILSILSNFDSDIFGIPGLLYAVAIPMAMAIIFSAISKKYSMTTQQTIFFRFYNVKQEIQKWKDLKSNQSKKKSRSSVFKLRDFINGWVSSSPAALRETPNSITTNLDKKIIPMINNDEFEQIDEFQKILSSFLTKIYDAEPKIEDLKQLESELNDMKEIPESTGTHDGQNTIFNQYPQLKWIWISPVFGTIFYFTLINVDSTQIHSSLAFSVTASIAIFVGIITLVKRK